MSDTQRLMAFLDNSPSCFHAIANLTRQLEEAGYTPLSEAASWQLQPGGKYYLTRNQSALIAFRAPQCAPQGFMLAASHSDRPCFKVKENPELETAGVYLRLAVERYGGMLMAPTPVCGRAGPGGDGGGPPVPPGGPGPGPVHDSQCGHSHEPEGQRWLCL